jgi:hypothetical protein
MVTEFEEPKAVGFSVWGGWGRAFEVWNDRAQGFGEKWVESSGIVTASSQVSPELKNLFVGIRRVRAE